MKKQENPAIRARSLLKERIAERDQAYREIERLRTERDQAYRERDQAKLDLERLRFAWRGYNAERRETFTRQKEEELIERGRGVPANPFRPDVPAAPLSRPPIAQLNETEDARTDAPSASVRAKTSAADPVNHPKHYNMGRFEVIDVIEDWQLNFHLGNAVKYIARAGHKGNKLEDLKKSHWYLDREIARLEKADAASGQDIPK